MAEREQLLKEKVDHTGIFDFKAFYGYAHSWFAEANYDGVDEEKYSEKVSGNARDIVIEWKSSKRMSDYFKIEHKIKFKFEKLTDVEVEIDGVKKSSNKGKVEMEIRSTLVLDHESKWEVSPMMRFWRDVYNKYIVPTRVDAMRGKCIGDGQKFKDDLKEFLQLSGKR